MGEIKKEMMVGENIIRVEENNILHIISYGDFDLERTKLMLDAVVKLTEPVTEKMNILIDLNNCGTVSAQARKVAKEEFEKDKTGKVALIGMHPVARVLASFVIGLTKKKDMRFFKTGEEAMIWLKE